MAIAAAALDEKKYALELAETSLKLIDPYLTFIISTLRDGEALVIRIKSTRLRMDIRLVIFIVVVYGSCLYKHKRSYEINVIQHLKFICRYSAPSCGSVPRKPPVIRVSWVLESIRL